MKRILSLMLCALMLCGVLASCTTIEGNNNSGMVIDIYLTTELYDFDPAAHYDDDAMVKVLDLIYEGITDLDENGKWTKAMMKKYTFKENVDDGYTLTIDLKTSRWTDGRTVQAADFVYAWKRILDPDFACEAAALLFDVKNARAVKLGDVSVDDVAISAVDTYTIQIDFDYKVDVDAFLTKLASPALVALREDIVTRNPDNWAKQTSTITTNGPFALKEVTKGEVLRLERSAYYHTDPDSETEAIDKYVIPYRLTTDYTTDLAAQLAKFEAGELFYLGEIPLSARAQYADTAVISDALATHTYFFNTNNELFSDSRVRQALSMAIDRNEIVNIVTYAKAATGLIPEKVYETTKGTSFRTTGGDLISTTADVAGAKSLLSAAGVTSGSFTITVRPNEVDVAVAEYVAGVWNSLGFTVTVEQTSAKKVSGLDKAYSDTFATAYKSGDFDVIAVDFQMLSTDAFTALAPFAESYSGNGVDMNSATYDLRGHVTGYLSEEYEALIDAAYAETDAATRATILHEAEELLLTDMPVCPLFFMQDAYLIHDGISGNKDSYFGTRDFKRMKLENYMEYLPPEMQDTTEAEETEA